MTSAARQALSLAHRETERHPRLANRVVLLTTSLAEGGAETVVKQLALALRKEGCEVSVVSMLEPTAYTQELEEVGVSVVSLSMSRSGLNLGGIARLFSCVRQFRPDVIHAHMFHASILARGIRTLLKIPVVCTVHSEIECSHLKKSGGLRELAYRVTDRASDCTTAVSQRVRDRYLTRRLVRRAGMPIVENGVDPSVFQPDSDKRAATRHSLGWSDRFIWLAVGRLEDPKDYPRMIRAFAPVHKKWPTSHLVIAGEGRLRGEMEATIRETESQDAVTLLGSRQDVPALMNAADAFTLASEWEGCPLVLLEAAASARAVVVTEVGAAPQIVHPDRTGFLVPPRNTEALTAGMIRLMQLPEHVRAQMGEQGRQYIVDHYSLDKVHRDYQTLYERVMTANR